ncbi:sensor histidine kinase [Paenibacillus sp. J5C2022]|uniref:sensor histidine kinase n=1 Tax=Paenibacillus sp. J5C2022 TaxID=2977129 RepID=UPI0021CF9A0D|nr:histidine kinase [Paenibacillus sp. J5C2022]
MWSEKVITQANQGLNRYLDGYMQSLVLLSSSSMLKEWMIVPEENFSDHFNLYRRMEREFANIYFFHYPEIQAIHIENSNGRHLNYTNGIEINEDTLYNADNWRYRQEVPFGISVESNLVDYYKTDGNNRVIPVLQLFYKLQWNGEQVTVSMDIDMSLVLDVLRTVEFGKQGEGMIVDHHNLIIANQNVGRIGELIPEEMQFRMVNDQGAFKTIDKEFHVIYASLEKLPWRTVVIVPYDQFAQFFTSIANITLLIAAVSVLVSILLSNIFATTFTRRIHSLRKAIKLMESGHWQHRIGLKGTDEIFLLSQSYNLMLDHLDVTVRNLAETQVKEKQALMSALQSQIDSHFLYNTLETIHSKAHLAGESEIEQTVECLSEMLRYSSSFHDRLVTLGDELQHLVNYAEISKIRFQERFHYHIEMDESLRQARCLKAMLQTIAENSVKYSHVPSIYLHISIHRLHEDYVKIDMKDNGVGFSENVLVNLRQRLQSTSKQVVTTPSIGLLNVHSRLIMHYGFDSKTGLYVSNNDDGIGANVSIIFPLEIEEHLDG